jgi:predicted nucleic acid-binding protein
MGGVIDTVLLDTNIVSFLFKKDNRAKAYAPHLQGKRQMISFVTVAELYQWATIRNWGERRIGQLEHTFRKYTILLVDIALCRRWGDVRAKCRAAGQPISPQDAWIAATALQYMLPLITHNPSDFEAVSGLEIITTVR